MTDGGESIVVQATGEAAMPIGVQLRLRGLGFRLLDEVDRGGAPRARAVPVGFALLSCDVRSAVSRPVEGSCSMSSHFASEGR